MIVTNNSIPVNLAMLADNSINNGRVFVGKSVLDIYTEQRIDV